MLTATCPVPAPPDEPDWQRLPNSRGVVVFESAGGRTSLVTSGANVRALARRRLGAGNKGPRALDLRSVTSVIWAVRTGSAFESDLVYLELARERLPHVYRTVTDRWQGWFIEVEPGAEFPRFSKVSTSAMGPEAGRRHIGPVADKHGAARFIEILEDLFDLCRYHHVLMRAPSGTPCVYKEMGKCPAPCDGSETMGAYRARLGEALRFAIDPGGAIEVAEAEMRRASAALDFERAEERRRWIERAAEATRKKFREIGDLASLRMVAVAPSERPDWARLIAIGPGAWSVAMDVRRRGPFDGLVEATRRALEVLGPCRFTRPEMDRLGLVCTWLARSEKMRRGVRFVRFDECAEEALVEAVGAVAPDAGENEEPTQEIGGEGLEEAGEP